MYSNWSSNITIHQGVSDTVERYDINENKWTFVSPMLRQRSAHCATTDGKRFIYAIGGYSETTIEQYDIERDCWAIFGETPCKVENSAALYM